MRYAEHAARSAEKRNAYRTLCLEQDHLEGLDVDERVVLKWIRWVVGCIYLAQGSDWCEHDRQISTFIKGKRFPGKRSNRQLLRKLSVGCHLPLAMD
jgi:hypothetical protein